MRANPKTESPLSEGSSPPKQDPLERRRLQNRLSQRNHRRKIRDRIAKLQERVIANELRAAAALNGWDQTYQAPFISTRHNSSYYQKPEMTLDSRDPSPQSTEPSTPFFPSHSFPQTYSTDLLTQSPELPGDASCHFESGCLGSQVPSPVSPGMQVATYQDMEAFPGSWGTLKMGDPVSFNQPDLCVATESSLPHILHALETSPSQPQIIVLVCPEFLPALQSRLGSNHRPMNSTSSMDALKYTETDGMRQNPLGMTNTTCHCPPQNAYSLFTPQMFSRAWTAAGPYQTCGSHKTPDNFSALHI